LSIARREISRGRLARQARIIKIPLLVVAGEEDQIVDPQSVGAWAGGVEKAEICLIDGCGHLPMIERTAEFDAQVLAFLTGDARYLQYAQSAPAAGDDDPAEDHETGEEGPELGYREEDDEAYAPDPGGPSDDTADLAPYRQETDGDEPEPEGSPSVVRKRSGGYPPRNRAPRAPEDYPNGAQEEDGVAEDFTEERPTSRDRGGRATSDEDVIPELPGDLFDWPEAPGDFGTRGRSRRDAPQEEPNEDHPDAPEGPARF
jgi:hypothetical protein